MLSCVRALRRISLYPLWTCPPRGMAAVNQIRAMPEFGPTAVHPQTYGPEGWRAPLALETYVVINQERHDEVARGRNEHSLCVLAHAYALETGHALTRLCPYRIASANR